jgi:hypothetical protein
MKIKLLIWFTLLFIGCGYSEGPVVLHDKFSEIQQEIINPTCGSSSTNCHADSTTKSGLCLKPGVSYYQLMHHKITLDAPEYQAIIVPNHPESSFLIEKLTDPNLSNSNPKGTRMPQGQAPLSDDQIAAIKSWIQNGALNN